MLKVRTSLVILVGAVLVAAAGCGGNTTPTSPDPSGGPVAVQMTTPGALGTPVGLVGVVRQLDLARRTFTLEGRSGRWAVRGDDATVVLNRSGSRVRFSSLQEGLGVGVRGNDFGTYVLARSISITQ